LSEAPNNLQRKRKRLAVVVVTVAKKVYSQTNLTYTYDSLETPIYKGFEAREVW